MTLRQQNTQVLISWLAFHRSEHHSIIFVILMTTKACSKSTDILVSGPTSLLELKRRVKIRSLKMPQPQESAKTKLLRPEMVSFSEWASETKNIRFHTMLQKCKRLKFRPDLTATRHEAMTVARKCSLSIVTSSLWCEFFWESMFAAPLLVESHPIKNW